MTLCNRAKCYLYSIPRFPFRSTLSQRLRGSRM